MRALVIGADGFAGRWLTAELTAQGDTVVAAAGPGGGAAEAGGELIRVDVRDANAVDALVADAAPEVTYFLAGVSKRGAREALSAAAGVSVSGSVNTLVALARHAPGSRLLFVSSGFVYPSALSPQSEDSPAAPSEPYGAAKLAAELALGRLARVSEVDLVIARPFNHIGPGQREGFLIPTLASQLRRVADGVLPRLTVGVTTDVRDFTDVRDVVAAYRLLALEGKADAVYNIASGEGRQISSVIDTMIGMAGVDAPWESRPPGEVAGPASLIGDPTRIRELGWSPHVPFEQSLRDVLAEHMPTGWAQVPAGRSA